MPYIPKDLRHFPLLDSYPLKSCGELNYAITRLCHDYLHAKGLNYSNINEVIGVLECAKLELYRMIAAPYENEKKEQNGSISELDNNKGE